MTAYDWFMAFGVIAIIALVVKAFWQTNKIDAIQQPDNWGPKQGTTTDGHSPGGD